MSTPRNAFFKDVMIERLTAENAELRRQLDNIKVRAYELGQRELHDMALNSLSEKQP